MAGCLHPLETPNPESIAPELDPFSIPPFIDEIRFLFEGEQPLQTGLDPAAVEPHRVAVVTGSVFDRDGTPLADVVVGVLGHPELGVTATRADGQFDLVVNGGGSLTLAFQKANYVTAQRAVVVPWEDFVALETLHMVALDSHSTEIDLGGESSEMQVAVATPVVDEDGARTTVVLFPPGSQATMLLPSGDSVPLVNATVRATELTVGPNGLSAMPAPLPFASGYTYAVELSVDEAIAAGASSVEFDSPVIHYVENFLSFPVGEPVPTGYYDREQGVWLASDNGLVVEVGPIEVEDDDVTRALLILAETGEVASAEELVALGVTDPEREQLATLYDTGDTLWRVPIPHFSPWDCNWPYVVADGATNGPNRPLIKNKPGYDYNQDVICNSVVGVGNQSLGVPVPLAGVPFELNYQSDRASARDIARRIELDLLDEVPESLLRVDLEVTVSGQTLRESFSPTDDDAIDITWDGRDRYGRAVLGVRSAQVRVGYVYPAVYAPGWGAVQRQLFFPSNDN